MKNCSVGFTGYTIGADSYDFVVQMCKPFGRTAVVIGGETSMEVCCPILNKAISSSSIEITGQLWFGGEASLRNAEILSQNPRVKEADMLFAVGGGKAIDTVKYVAGTLGKPFFTFPTIASKCAATSSVAVMYNDDHSTLGTFYFDYPARHCFINSSIIVKAPYKYLWAGIGDTYAKYFECMVSSRNDSLSSYNNFGVSTSIMSCEPIIKHGKEALENVKSGVISEAFNTVITSIIVCTGYVSTLLTIDRSPNLNSGLAHAMYYAVTKVHTNGEHLHGEIVSLGVLLLLLVDNDIHNFKRIYEFNKLVGLPVTTDQIGLSEEEIHAMIPLICEARDIKHYAYSVSEEMLSLAFEKLNKYNREFV